MKKIYICILIVFTLLLTGCGENPKLTKFHSDIDDFCNKIVQIDTSINNIDPDSDTAVNELLSNLDELDLLFQAFSRLDFPEEFDYLESIAAESSSYMTTAVNSYHEAYSNASYNEYTAEYAQGNYERAYKRVQIIISFLHGETPDDVAVTES